MKQQGTFSTAGSKQIHKVRLLSSVFFSSWLKNLVPHWTTLVSSTPFFLYDQGRPKQGLEHCFVRAGEYVIQWESVCVGKTLGSPGERYGRMDWMVAWMIKNLQFYRNREGDDAGVNQEAPRGEDIVSELPYKGRIKGTIWKAFFLLSIWVENIVLANSWNSLF